MNSITHIVHTPCGFDIWIIPLKNGTVRFRVFFSGQEVGLQGLSDLLSMEGLKLLGTKIKEI